MRAPAINPRASVCPTCGRVYSSATTAAECPVDAAKRREQERAEKSLGIDRPQSTGLSPNNADTWENRGTTKNGPNVTGAQTPQSGPNPYQGGAGMNRTATTHTSRAEGGAP